MHDLDNARTFVVDQVKQLGTQHRISLWGDVVFAAHRQWWQAEFFVV